MKSMILNNVKQRHLVEKVMKRYSIGWKTEESWMARWNEYHPEVATQNGSAWRIPANYVFLIFVAEENVK